MRAEIKSGRDILIIDDEKDIRTLMGGILEDEGYKTLQAGSGEQALELINRRMPGLVILDVWLEGSEIDGIELLESLQQSMPGLPVVMISGHATIDIALKAMRMGATDFLTKPFKSDLLLYIVEKTLKNSPASDYDSPENNNAPIEIVGKSAPMQKLRQEIEWLAPNKGRVLITGEMGTGKTVAARSIHALSKRTSEAFLTLDCALVSRDGFEHALLGHSGSGSGVPVAGMLEKAHGGTLLVENVDKIPLAFQAKLARILHENAFVRPGGKSPVEFDVRIISTNRENLYGLSEKGNFSFDLYHRLNVIPLQMPPLRERRDDIPLLVDTLLSEGLNEWRGVAPTFSREAMNFMCQCEWPANLWELRNVLERLVIFASENENRRIEVTQIRLALAENHADKEDEQAFLATRFMHLPLKEAREVFEKLYLDHQLKSYQGNISRMAEHVGMDRSALHRKIKILGLAHKEQEEIEVV